MNKLIFALAFLFSSSILAQGLNAPFHGVSDLCGPNMVSSKTIGCWVAENLDASGGLIDATENLVTYSEEIDDANDWIEAGTASVQNDIAYAPDGTYTADLVALGASGNGVSQVNIDIGNAGDAYSPSFYINANGETGTLVFENAESSVSGQWTIDLSKLSGWERVSRNHHTVVVVNEMIGHVSGECGPMFYMNTGTASVYLWGNQIESQHGYFHVGPYIHTATSVKKTRLDMTATGSPPSAASDYQDANGNRIRAMSLNGVDQWQSHAHDSVMDVYDGDFVLSMVIASESATDTFFGNGANSVDGISCAGSTTYFKCQLNKGGAGISANSPACDVTDGLYHVVQFVRESNTATFYLDGVAGTSVDVTGYGIDHSRLMYLGAYDAGATSFDGDILYARIDREALSSDELSRQSDTLMGLASSLGRYNESIWDVQRTTIASQEFSNKSMSDAAVDRARVGGQGGGLLVEKQSTNLVPYSQEFDQWSTVRSSMVMNTADVLAPDGSQTVDILHEDGTLANSHYILSATFSVTSGDTYTYSVFVKPINRDWIYLFLYGTGITGSTSFNVSTGKIGTSTAEISDIISYPDGFYRVSITETATGTSTATARIYVSEADNDITFDGLDQDSLYVWGAQVEEGLYATSPIETGATAVTRTADSITLDLHQDALASWIAEEDPLVGQTVKIKCDAGDTVRIEWGDDSNEVVTCNAAQQTLTHSYTVAGQYLTRITGAVEQVTFLNLGSTSVSGDIANLSGLTSLTYLYLSNTSVSGDIANLSGLTSLTYLSLYNTSVSGDIANLSGLTSLTSLYLGSTSVSGDIANLSGMTSLINLYLSNTSVSGDIANLSGMTSLTYLYLSNITGRGMTYTTTGLPAWNVADIRFDSSGLDASEVDQFLIDFDDGEGTAGTLNLAGDNGTRTVASDVAIGNIRITGWVVTVNE